MYNYRGIIVALDVKQTHVLVKTIEIMSQGYQVVKLFHDRTVVTIWKVVSLQPT